MLCCSGASKVVCGFYFEGMIAPERWEESVHARACIETFFLVKMVQGYNAGGGGVEGVDAGCYSDSEMRLCRGPLASVRLKKGDMYCSGWLLILLSPLEGRVGAVLHIHSPYFPTGHGIWLFVTIMVAALLCLFGPLIVFSRPSWTAPGSRKQVRPLPPFLSASTITYRSRHTCPWPVSAHPPLQQQQQS